MANDDGTRNYDRPVSGISLAGSFADAWCHENPEETIGLIPCAEGGSTLDEWHVDQALFRHAITEAKFAMENSELTGILWHQGESDSMNGKYKVYYQKLLSIMKAFREELNAPNIPIIIGGLGDFLGKEGSEKIVQNIISSIKNCKNLLSNKIIVTLSQQKV